MRSKKLLPTILSTLASVLLAVSPARAALENPALSGSLLASNPTQATDGTSFARYFVHLWNAMLGVGAIVVLVFLIWGAVEWITSGGDKGKLENARNRITQAILGLVILVGSFAIIGFIGELLFGDSFDILNIKFPSAL